MVGIIKLAPADERELQAAAAHEAGHEFVANRFGLQASCFVANLNAGACVNLSGTPKQNAAVGWAGTLAEDLLNLRRRVRRGPNVSLSLATLPDWCAECGELQCLSGPDLTLVKSYTPTCDAALLAFDVLSGQLNYLRNYAAMVASVHREQVHAAIVRGDPRADEDAIAEFAASHKQILSNGRRDHCLALAATVVDVPLPEIFPANVEHFAAIVVADCVRPIPRSAASRMVKFCEHLMQAGGVDFYKTVFASEISWRVAFHQYRDWLVRQPREETAP